MSWDQYRKGQTVSFRVNGGWKKGIVSEAYADSASVTYQIGSTDRTARIYDLRNIKPWDNKPKNDSSTLSDQPSLGF